MIAGEAAFEIQRPNEVDTLLAPPRNLDGLTRRRDVLHESHQMRPRRARAVSPR